MTSPDVNPPPRVIALAERVFVFAAGAGVWAILYSATNAARQRHGSPPLLPRLQQIVDASPYGFVIAVPSLVALISWLILDGFRRMLSPSQRARFPWFKPPGQTRVPPPPLSKHADSRPAIASALCSLMGTCLLLIGLWHVRSDRTHRQPVITWEGPLAEYVGILFSSGWVLSGLGIAIGGWAISQFCGRYNWLGYLGNFIGQGNLFVSCIVTAGLYED